MHRARMKRNPQPARKPSWISKIGWPLAILLLIGLGIQDLQHKDAFKHQQADFSHKEAEWSRKEGAYFVAARFLYLYTNAPAALNQAQVLAEIGRVKTVVVVTDAFKSRVNADDFHARLDLELKKAGVPIDPKSAFELSLLVDGQWDDSNGIVMPLLSLNLNESVPVRRGPGFSLISVASYRAMRFGAVREPQAPDALLKMIESLVASFSKDYATVNKKPPETTP